MTDRDFPDFDRAVQAAIEVPANRIAAAASRASRQHLDQIGQPKIHVIVEKLKSGFSLNFTAKALLAREYGRSVQPGRGPVARILEMLRQGRWP